MRRRLVLAIVVAGVMATAALPATALPSSAGGMPTMMSAATIFPFPTILLILGPGDPGSSCRVVLRANAPTATGNLAIGFISSQAQEPCSRLGIEIVPPEPVQLPSNQPIVLRVSCNASGPSFHLVAAGNAVELPDFGIVPPDDNAISIPSLLRARKGSSELCGTDHGQTLGGVSG